MKFARHLAEEGSEPELHSLYKQLKKSLRIFEGPADAGSAVDVPRTLPSSDDEAEELEAEAGATGAAVQEAGAPGAAQQGAQQQAGPPGEQQGPAQQQQRRRPAPEQEAQFVALVEQCVQQLNEDYLAREELLVIKADIAQQACAAAHSREQQLEAYSSVVNVHGELVLLCHWSMCAYTGIVKILKKHHKRTGQRVQSALLANLMSQPFCSLEEVRGLVRQAEQQMAALAGALGLPPSRSPTAAAAAAAVRDPAAEVQQLQQPAAAAAGRDSPAVGDSSAAAQQAPVVEAPTSGAASMEQEQSPEQAQHSAQQGGAPAAAAPSPPAGAAAAAGPAAVSQIDVVAASGGSEGCDRPALKRDRSKVYAPVAKRQERELKAAAPQPASSGSSMQVSHSEGTPGAGADDSASSGQRRTIMQRTKAALQLWKALRTNVSTPSTVAVQPPCVQQPPERQH